MRSGYAIPLAILAGGLVIAVSVFVLLRTHGPQQAADSALMRPVDATDHILGNPAAPVMFVEYSDIDCAFCKSYQSTMESLMAAYAAGGQVALAYRYLPVIEQDADAETDAEAAECVASQGGAGAFFRFIDAVAAAAPGSAQFDPSEADGIVKSLGLDTDTFDSCLSSHASQSRVLSDANNALAAGATGAPYTLVLIRGQMPIAISGAFSYDQMNDIVEAALAKLKGS